MCGKKGGGTATMPAQAVAAKAIGQAATVKTLIKEKERTSNPDILLDGNKGGTVGEDTQAPATDPTGTVPLGTKRKRRAVVGLDL